jgi:Dolichyl-phosphate-mannose-protein mannosyltransferase
MEIATFQPAHSKPNNAKTPLPSVSPFILTLAIILLSIFLVREISTISRQSITFDETAHLPAGYSYIKARDYRLNYEHPPLCKLLAAVPLQFLRLSSFLTTAEWQNAKEWEYGDKFLNHNTRPVDSILFWARIPIVVLGLLLGIFVFLWTNQIYGAYAALSALFVYTFSPNILAHSGLVTTDLGAACFIFISMYTFWNCLNDPRISNLILAGIAFGLALGAKYTCPVLLPPAYLILAYCHTAGAHNKKSNLPLIAAIAVPSALIVLMAQYQFNFNSATGFGVYISGLVRILKDTSNGVPGLFLKGKYSNYGWRDYFVWAFLLKTPASLIVLLILSIATIIINRLVEAEYFIIIPAVLLFLLASFSRKQLGLRYILPIYPFLYVFICGRIASLFNKRALAVMIGLCFLWYGYESIMIHPHYLAYFNEFAGGPDAGWKYLGDSNIDWGQDLKGLSEYLRQEGSPELILSYFGTADPAAYGIAYQPLCMVPEKGLLVRKWQLNSLTPKREYLAVSATNLMGIYFSNHELFSWLKSYPVKRKIGYSIFVYDISSDINAREKIYGIYIDKGLAALADREKHVLEFLKRQDR